MKKRTKQKIKRISLLIVVVLVTSFGLIIYNFLGPFRSFFWNAPYISGFLGTRSYLVLLQNNNELRPSGGFITAAAKVSVLFGYPTIEVFDSYQVADPNPRIPAPEAFEYFIGQNDRFFGGWTFRDSNFSPDFSVSAQEALRMYQLSHPESHFDAVVALDFSVIEKLLENYGPIEVEDVTFDQQSFFNQSQRISKNVDTHNIEELKNRKNILKPFVKELIKKVSSQPTQYGELFRTLSGLAEEKHVLAYSTSPSFQQKLESHHLAGRITPAPENTDSLHINISNIGGRKADRYVSKEIKYRADFSNPENKVSHLEIILEHLGSYNIQSDIYQAYIRSYVPLNSQLIRSSGTTLRGTGEFSDIGMTVFDDYIRIKPGEKVTLNYWYKLPETILPEQYRLEIDKQAGVENQYWDVAIKHMNDSTMANAPSQDNSLEKMRIRENLAFWRGEVEEDIIFHLYQQIDQQGPVVLWQEFVDLNTINVRFNELLDPLVSKDIENYQIIDLNKKNSLIDIITVTKARFDERDLWLTIEGATPQEEEQYQLIMTNIADLNGNTVEPNPLSRTLVQRLDGS